jgi:predicted metalloprotease with PDZ domain
MANRFPSLGWCIVFGSVACMGASLALAQRAEPDGLGRPNTPAAAQPDRVRRDSSAQDQQLSRRDPSQEARSDDRREGADLPGRLGISFQGLEDLVVGEVAPGSQAAEAGFRPQDRILSVAGRPISDQRHFSASIHGQAGRRIPIVIERDGRQYTIHFKSAETGDNGAWLGVYLQEGEETDRPERGARVTQVYPAGPAARAGLRPGDVILSLNEQQVDSPADLVSAIEGMKPQTKAALRILRGNQQLEATAVLASRDSYIFHQSGYSDRGEQRGEQRGEDDYFSSIPPYAMQLEHDRRMAEQHERIENELRKLQEEVRKLREALERR